MKSGITSKEAILRACRKIAAERGLTAISMRTVAQECGVALGTLYNYYEDKDALLLATVESVWQDIFHGDTPRESVSSFPDYVSHLFACARKGAEDYPDFLTAHAVVLARSQKGEAKGVMEQYFTHMRAGLLAAMRADPAVDAAAFSPDFSQEALADLVLEHILLLLVKKSEGCGVLAELLRRAVCR